MKDFFKQIADTILAVAKSRGAEKTICPSEIARMMFPEDWRKHMGTIVNVAIDLQRQRKVMITQNGLPVDVDHIRGPIRIKIS